MTSLLGTDAEHVPGEVVVRFRAGLSPESRAHARSQVAARVLERLPIPHTELVALEPGTTVAEAMSTFESDPAVLYAEPNFIYSASATPNDPRFGTQWALNNTTQTGGIDDADIDAPEAWDVTTGSKDVVVAVVDTGIAHNNPDLAPNIWTNPGETGAGRESNGVDDDNNGFIDDWRGWDFFQGDSSPRDLVGHGTHVAGTIGAVGNDGYGMAGVNWRSSLMALRALGPDGEGTTAQVAAAFVYARDNGADIVNASLGGSQLSLTVSDAIATSPDVLFVVAAGNEAANNDTTASYPCNIPAPNLVCVAATDESDNLAGFSNYGAVNVDLAAPGTRIASALPPLVSVFREGFELGLDGWVTGGTGTAWSRTSDQIGGYAADSAGGNYVANSDSWMRTAAAVDLAGYESCQLLYFMRLDAARDDGLLVEASTDLTTWTKLGGWAGSTGGGWLSLSEDLSAFDGKATYIRFRLVSNAVVHSAGADIDDISVKCLGSTYTGNEYASFSGTSMATPHVAGAAALVLSVAPDASIASLRGALLAGVDALPGLVGRTVTGGRLNLAKALSVVTASALPTASPTPTPSSSASPTATPTPTTTPTPSPTPTESDEPPGVIEHVRQVSLGLKGHLNLSGRVSVPDGPSSCLANVTVNIRRNGRFLKRITADSTGAFSVRVRDRAGRYRVRVPGIDVEDGRCAAAMSTMSRHTHR